MVADPTPRNHLAGQAAAYLVQHAHDPVAWYPWGVEAFETARSLGRPIFLSIGYASCHWCHVMQRESFRDDETARYLNEHFVSVKVDRDERPDIDHLYQQYVTVASGSGGWPMSAFLDGLGRPLYGGTYFPKRAPYNMQSFAAVLTGVERTYREQPERVAHVVAESMMVLADLQAPKPVPDLSAPALDGVVAGIMSLDDREFGRLGGAPKYPAFPLMDLLIAYHRATGSSPAVDIAGRWMYAMLRGGIFDQAGGGIFRYSTDSAWLVPHFEKMLVDNAQLLRSIAALYRLSPSEELARAARQTAAFLERDLARPGGGYWSSVDAESAGIEGGAYTWSAAEFGEVLTPSQLDLARRHLGVTADGNWRGKAILTRREGRSQDSEAVDEVLEALLAARAARPLRAIENAVAETNALTALGLIEAGDAIGDASLVRQGLAVVDWVRREMETPAGIIHMLGDPHAEATGSPAEGPVTDVQFLADHAALALAEIAAADASPASAGADYLAAATKRIARVLELFEQDGTLFMSAPATDLPTRPAAYDDVPSPSGWALALEAMQCIRPEEHALWARLFGPLVSFAFHAPRSAGAALRLAIGAVWPEQERTGTR